MRENKKVCIVVPVYNAEKYLGYCLNSIWSQTYTNWTAILVDDGSTDGSLDICRQYESMDSRFRVISKPNGGVSSARNAGLALAQGDYLEFLDSDDCLAHDTLEKQVRLAEAYNSQLIIMDIMMVDFSNPDLDRVMLSSAWLNQSPCLLSPEEFKAKRMQLVWLTVLLECLHAKLYDLSLWKKLDLTFPEDLSLGEDFVTNMKYFEACNNAVFLHECGHYYNCIMGSSSLTQKYRANLFETKMYLIEELEKYLGGRNHLSAPELDAFYCYTASNGLSAVERAILDSGMREDQLVARLQEMFAHPLFAESIRHASYIPDRFVECIEPAKQNNFAGIIRYIADEMFQKGMKPAEEVQVAQEEIPHAQEEFPVADSVPEVVGEIVPALNPGLLNRMVRKLLRMLRPLVGSGAMDERVGRWEHEIAQMGLKCTLKKHIRDHKKVTRNVLECQTLQLEAQINGIHSHLEERCNALDQCVSERIWEQTAASTAEIRKVEGIIDQTATHLQNMYTRVSATELQLKKVDDKVSAAADQLRKVDDGIFAAADQLRNVDDRVSAAADQLRKVDDRISAAADQLHSVDNRISAAADQLRSVDERISTAVDQLWKMDGRVSAAADQIWKLDEKIAASTAMLQENLSGYVWLSEQRMTKLAYQRDINELRQRKKAIMLATAEHGNIGDSAITLAEQQILSEQFPEYFQVEISTYEFNQKEAYLHAILNPEDIIFVNGGGNMGDRYIEEEELHRKIVREFPNNKIVIFPQTISFSTSEQGAQEIAKSARVYNSHKDLTLFVRGETSLAFAQKYFDKVKTILMPDVVHVLRSQYAIDRSGALLCLREDEEGSLNEAAKERIRFAALAMTGNVTYSTNTHSEDVSREIRGFVVRKELMRFASHRVVITDRLHGMIFAAVTGTPCVVLASSDHKIQEYYNAFFHDSNTVFFVGNDADALDDAIKQALQVTDAICPIFEKNPHGLIRSVTMEQ